MSTPPISSIGVHRRSLPDSSRLDCRTPHKLLDIIVIIICGRDRERIATAIEISENFTNLNSVVKVTAQREVCQKVGCEIRYYISSLPGDAAELLEVTRRRRRIENSCQWELDVAFREVASRVRRHNAAENLAIVRRIALNLLKAEESTKLGVANKRLKAA